ncbi:MAG: hypothetical protein ACK5MA_02575 [Parachlamydiaceae bacterium]
MSPFKALFCFLLLLLTSCGYRIEENFSADDSPVYVNIPYIDGDEDGKLTSALIKELSSSGKYLYSPSGELQLIVTIDDYYDENIGFRYDRSRKGRLKHYIIPTETRSYMLVEVELRSAFCEEVARVPVKILASMDYDHDYYIIRHGVNIFSLGQLTDVDTAEEAALVPLEKKMAEKIVDYVVYGW